ncbi:hypothetical protein SO802_005623 [Lithocarpus litseifolius]|uniref:Uncharacterized protein n=1 Tax=Lithocarpus litseifolius TaxID=425828 RepID=A0AAW2DIN5_9ROSI
MAKWAGQAGSGPLGCGSKRVKRKWIVVWILAHSHAPKVNHPIQGIQKGSNNFRG